MSQLQAGTQSLSAGLNELAQKTDLPEDKKANITTVQNGLNELNGQLQNAKVDSTTVTSVKSNLEELSKNLEQLETIQVTEEQKAVASTSAFTSGSLTVDQKNEILAAIQNSANSSAVQTNLIQLRIM